MADKVSPKEAALLGLSMKQKVDEGEAASVGLPLRQGKQAQLADIVRKERGNFKAGAKAGGQGLSKLLDDASDVAGNARSAAMGFTLNAADAPESLYKTIQGDDPGYSGNAAWPKSEGWHTGGGAHEKYMADVAQHPISNIIGAGLQPTPFGKAKAVTTAGKLALSAGRVGYAGGQGALANYLGQGDNPRAQDMGPGGAALASGGMQAGMEVASPVLGKVAGGLKQFARGRSLATLSPAKADIAKLNQLGIADSVADDLYKSGGFGPLSTTEGVAERLNGPGGIVEKRGSALGDYINKIDDASGGTTTQPSAAADRIERMSAEQFGKTPAYRAKNVMAKREADAIRKQYGNATMSLADSENYLKRGYDEEAIKRIGAEAKGAAPSPKTDALALTREAIKKQNEDAAEAVAGSLAPDLKGQFVPLKQGFGRMAEAGRIADKTGGPKTANRYLSPSDYGFGIASGQAYGSSPIAEAMSKPAAETLMGLAGSIAHKQVRTRGSAAMAHMAYPASAAAGVAGKAVGAINNSPAGAAAAGSLLEQYLSQPAVDDDERQKQAAAHFTKSTGG